MPRIKLCLAYVGTAYHGWQTQYNANTIERCLPTVQSRLMEAVKELTGLDIYVHGAGRTDSGVHAEGQVVHMDVPDNFAGFKWQLALNTRLPKDIRVISAQITKPSFNAQRDALYKTYSYSLWLNQNYVLPRLYPFVWVCGPLDLDLIKEACGYLLGEHDFSSLQNAGTTLASNVRTIYKLELEFSGQEYLYAINIEANGFLKQMVRNIAGLLAFVGRKKYAPDFIPEILAAKDRKFASRFAPTAPAQGLTMVRVCYPEN